MKNKKSLLIGIIVGLSFILIINGMLQYLVISFLGVELNGMQFSINGLIPKFIDATVHGDFFFSLLLLLPLILNILFIEVSFLLLSKSGNGLARYSIIVALIVVSGYLIISIFYGLIELIVSPLTQSLWKKLVEIWQIEGNQIFALVFFVVLILFGYLQIMQKRLMQYLVVAKQNQS